MPSKPPATKPTKVSAKAKAAASKIRATLPPRDVQDSDVVDVAKSMACFEKELARARTL